MGQGQSFARAEGRRESRTRLRADRSFHSFVGEIADVEIEKGEIKVRRVHAVVDCGFAIDPPNVAAQVRSGINYGLTAALYGRVDFDNGKIVQANFDAYPLLSLDDGPGAFPSRSSIPAQRLAASAKSARPPSRRPSPMRSLPPPESVCAHCR